MRSLVRLAGVTLGTALTAAIVGRGIASPGPDDSTATSPVDSRPGPSPGSLPRADLRVDVQDFGKFRIRLDREGAPNAVAAFLALAATGAFDSLAFHRVIPGYVVQTGDPATRNADPTEDGVAAPPWRLPPERPTRSHRRGTVSLAWRNGDPASAGMQWFVALTDLPALDGRATPIGEVFDGLDVVDRISQVSTFRDWRPLRTVRITAVRLEAPAAPIAPAAETPPAAAIPAPAVRPPGADTTAPGSPADTLRPPPTPDAIAPAPPDVADTMRTAPPPPADTTRTS